MSFRLCSTLPPYALPLCTGLCRELTTVRTEQVHLCSVHATYQATQSAVRVNFQFLMCKRHDVFHTTRLEFSLTCRHTRSREEEVTQSRYSIAGNITCSHMIKMPPSCLTPKSPYSCMLMILSFCLSPHQVCNSVSIFYSCFVLKSFCQSICPKPRSSFSMIFAILIQILSCILISNSKLSSSTPIWA